MYTDPSGELAIFVHGGYGIAEVNDQGGGTFAYDMATLFVERPGYEELQDIIRTGPGGLHPAQIRTPNDFHDSVLDQTMGIVGLAERVIASYDEQCGEQPIVIFGVSRGGATAQLVAATVFARRPDVRIDLMATIAPVNSPDHPSSPAGLSVKQKMPNVTYHINFISEQRRAVFQDGDGEKDWPTPIVPIIPELTISGAMNWQIRGTSHRSIAGQPMGVFRKIAIPVAGEFPKPEPEYRCEYARSVSINPAWQRIKASIDALYR